MHENCGFECPDVLSLLEGFLQVPPSQLISGYTFPTVIDTNDPTYPVAWSGQTAAPLDPLEPIRLFIDSLMEEPSGITTVSPQDVITTARNLDTSAKVAFNPLFPGSFIFTGAPTLWGAGVLFGGLINGLVSRLCPTCATSSQTSATSTPPLTNSGQTFTFNAAPVALGGDAQQSVVTGNEVRSPNGQQDIQAGAGTATGAPSTAAGCPTRAHRSWLLKLGKADARTQPVDAPNRRPPRRPMCPVTATR